MNPLLFAGYLLLSVAKVPQGTETTCTVLTRPLVTPEAAFTRLANDVAALLRRALAEPNDIKTLAMLEGPEASQLLQRQKQQRPAFRKWLDAMPPAQRKAFAQRMMNNDLMRFMQSADQKAQVNARLEQNPKLAAAFKKLVVGIFSDET